MSTTEQRIITVLVEQFKIQPEVIAGDMTFGSLKFDSLVLIELGLILDKEFGIDLDAGELTEAMTIRHAAELVTAKKTAR
ncbi:acyl carrier protein [Streptomyces sp. NPDC017940]|uniref:acyl carrier protein n=1 Tax=Streptomyces sp. NPDC017940 TaxID=3365017 RepID=UPI0037AA2D2D